MRICFIDDDDEFEIPLFMRAFADRFDLITATTYSECADKIRSRSSWMPDLFVLDLYFPSGSPDVSAIEALRRQPITIADDQAQIRQSFSNYKAANSRLHSVLSAWKQGPNGGIALAQMVSEQYPGTPIVFYSRKATAEDALRCLIQDGVVDIISKPTGKTDQHTIDLTMALSESTASRFRHIISPANPEKLIENKQAARTIFENIRFFSEVNDARWHLSCQEPDNGDLDANVAVGTTGTRSVE
jgi:CheY-like chemotaxis protein